jgi:G3E family GTPase
VKSFVSSPPNPSTPTKLEDFLGSMVQIYGPRMLRYKGVLHVSGMDRKVVFQGVHQTHGQ